MKVSFIHEGTCGWQVSLIHRLYSLSMLIDVDLFCASLFDLPLISVNKQLNDKERVTAALENPSLRETVEKLITDDRPYE